MIWLFRVIFFVIFLLSGSVNAISQTPGPPQVLVEQGAFIVTYANKTVLEHNGDKLFVPASILKLVTDLAALHILGPEYRFTTRFYLDNDNNLYIRGGGDPFLVSENIREIALELKQRGINTIHNLFLDDSAYALEQPADGTRNSSNPYDAVNGALLVNFNTLSLLVHKNGTIQSAEPQTPLLPLTREAGKHLQYGQHRINVSSLPNSDILSLPLRYTGELFSTIFMEVGMSVSGAIMQKKICNDCQFVYAYKSKKNVSELVQANLKFSNNLIANQLFLTCGAQLKGFPATWEKARKALRDFARITLKLDSTNIFMIEGSGLSRKNRVSARAIIQVLHHFKPYSHLLSRLQNIPLKSGTLSDVFSYAGYFEDNSQQDPFVIILNQDKNNRDRLLKILRKHYLTIKEQKKMTTNLQIN